MLKIFKPYKTGLVLSGGGARGFAHLGVLQYLNDKKIKTSIISGVSAGALAGAFFADGYSPLEILEIFSNHKLYHLMRLTFPRTGFLKVHGLMQILSKNLKARNLEDLKIPMVITVTNFSTGKIEYIRKGNLVNALLATSAIPVLFESQVDNNQYYLDGGVMNNFPIEPIINDCSRCIGVHVNPLGNIQKIGSPVQVAERVFHLAIASVIEHKKHLCNYFIEPEKLENYGMLDIKKGHELFDIGYAKAKEILGK